MAAPLHSPAESAPASVPVLLPDGSLSLFPCPPLSAPLCAGDILAQYPGYELSAVACRAAPCLRPVSELIPGRKYYLRRASLPSRGRHVASVSELPLAALAAVSSSDSPANRPMRARSVPPTGAQLRPPALWQDYYAECGYDPHQDPATTPSTAAAGEEAETSASCPPERRNRPIAQARRQLQQQPQQQKQQQQEQQAERSSSLPRFGRFRSTAAGTAPPSTASTRGAADNSGSPRAAAGTDSRQGAATQSGDCAPSGLGVPRCDSNCQRWSWLLHHALSEEDIAGFSLAPPRTPAGSPAAPGPGLVAQSLPELRVSREDVEGAGPSRFQMRSRSLTTPQVTGPCGLFGDSPSASIIPQSLPALPTSSSLGASRDMGQRTRTKGKQRKDGRRKQTGPGIIRCLSSVVPASTCFGPTKAK